MNQRCDNKYIMLCNSNKLELKKEGFTLQKSVTEKNELYT